MGTLMKLRMGFQHNVVRLLVYHKKCYNFIRSKHNQLTVVYQQWLHVVTTIRITTTFEIIGFFKNMYICYFNSGINAIHTITKPCYHFLRLLSYMILKIKSVFDSCVSG